MKCLILRFKDVKKKKGKKKTKTATQLGFICDAFQNFSDLFSLDKISNALTLAFIE